MGKHFFFPSGIAKLPPMKVSSIQNIIYTLRSAHMYWLVIFSNAAFATVLKSFCLNSIVFIHKPASFTES